MKKGRQTVLIETTFESYFFITLVLTARIEKKNKSSAIPCCLRHKHLELKVVLNQVELKLHRLGTKE